MKVTKTVPADFDGDASRQWSSIEFEIAPMAIYMNSNSTGTILWRHRRHILHSIAKALITLSALFWPALIWTFGQKCP